MRFLIRLALFGLALAADASRLFELPGVSGRPLLFVALATCQALRAGALAGGVWGFGGGFALELLYLDPSVGSRALGGLLAGSVPTTFRGLLFWQRATGQAALGALAGALYDLTPLLVMAVHGRLVAPWSALLPQLLLDAALTGLACPLLFRATGRLERLA